MWTFTVSGQSYFTWGFVCLVFNGKRKKKEKKLKACNFSPDKWAEDRQGELIFL